MPDKEFNLLHEPWICVMTPDAEVMEVSILEAFRHAHTYRAISGELPTQNVAILRLLLAILHAVFGRVDVDGNEKDEDGVINALCELDPDAAYDRWQSLWELGKFPMKPIEDYLAKYEERFWLFHPETPFYQVADTVGTDYDAPKLNGSLSESGNKIRLFGQRSGPQKQELSFAEAARWLLNVNAYDDTSAKPSRRPGGDKLPSPGAGWLGKLGLIFASGNNLFETLVLNLVFLRQNGHECWGAECPIWETSVRKDERIEIEQPDCLSKLYTVQSRRLLLKRNSNQSIIGYTLLGGDFWQKENALNEPMTTWRNSAKKPTDPPVYVPARHSPQRQIWRDLAAIVVQSGSNRPEIINWIANLKNKECISKPVFCFQTPAVAYGDKDFFVDDIFNDSITFNISLLSKAGEHWIPRIIDELQTSDQLVYQLGILAKNLSLAAGADKEGPTPKGREDEYKMKAYYELDAAYRKWLERIDPETSMDIDATMDDWWNIAKNKVREIGYDLIIQSGANAFVGRPNQMTSSEAYSLFLYKTASRENLSKKSGGKK